MPLWTHQIGDLLSEFADWLAFENCEPVAWVVCGGTALALQNLMRRTTKDVDVIGAWDQTLLQIKSIQKFPDKVQDCIRKVAQAHPELQGMNERWINLGPANLAKLGLPAGYENRLMTVRFKDRLILHLLGREDLLSLKLYAAADDLAGRQSVHAGDLKQLKPTYEELDKALNWVLKLPNIDSKKIELQSIVQELGYDDLAIYI
jgi:hypothetical protein